MRRMPLKQAQRILLLLATLFTCIAVEPFGLSAFLPVKGTIFVLAGAMCLPLLTLELPKIWRNQTTRNFIIICSLFPLASSISLVFSVDPSRTFENSPFWPQHPLIVWAGWVLAVCATYSWQKIEYISAWVNLLLFCGLLISLFTWAQRFGIVPSIFPGSWVGSLAGGPIYLAGMLLFILPLAIWKLHSDFEARGKKNSIRWICSSLVLAVLLGAFLIAEKRGPTFALLAGGCSGLAFLGLYYRKKKMLTSALAVALFCLGFLLGLALLQKSGVPLREIPLIGRMAMIIPVGAQSGDHFRASLWEAASSFGNTKDPLVLPNGTADPFKNFRPWLGYGPDVVEAILPTRWVYTPAWPRPVVEKTCHSIFWDTKLGMGYTGLFSLFLLFGFTLWRGMVGLGLATDKWSGFLVFSVFSLAGTLLTGLTFLRIYGAGFLGLGMQVGLLLGALLFALMRRGPSVQTGGCNSRALLLVALLTSLICHWIDMAFITQTGITGPLFWMLTGAVVSLGAAPNKPGNPGEADGLPGKPVWLFLSFILFFLGMLHANSLVDHNRLWIGGLHHLFFISLSVAVPAGCYLRWLENKETLSINDIRTVLQAAIICLIGVWLVGIVLTRARFGIFSGSMIEQLPLRIAIWSWAWAALFLFSFILLFYLCIREEEFLPAKRLGIGMLLVLVVSALWGVFIANSTTLPWLKGEIFHGLGTRISEPCLKAALLQSALEQRPGNYRARLSMSSLTPEILEKFGSKQYIIEDGLNISEFNLLSSALGEEKLRSAFAHKEEKTRLRLAGEALEAFQIAGRAIKQNENAWFMAFIISKVIFNDSTNAAKFNTLAQEAIVKREHPNLPVNTLGWADFYLQQSTIWKETEIENCMLERSLYFYTRAWNESSKALEKNGHDQKSKEFWNPRRFSILVGRGHALMRLKRFREAAESYQTAAEIEWKERPYDPLPFAARAHQANSR